MNVVKVIVLAVVLAIGYGYWSKHRAQAPKSHRADPSYVSAFVSLPPTSDASNRGVTIFAAEGCPEEAAQRADRLAEQLAASGIPVSRSSHVNFSIPQGDPAVAQAVMSVMNGELPIVLVRGKARANPTLQEVVSEYSL